MTCYVCLEDQGKIVCNCKNMYICEKCQCKSIKITPSFKDNICPICKSKFTNIYSSKKYILSISIGFLIISLAIFLNPLSIVFYIYYKTFRTTEIIIILTVTILILIISIILCYIKKKINIENNGNNVDIYLIDSEPIML